MDVKVLLRIAHSYKGDMAMELNLKVFILKSLLYCSTQSTLFFLIVRDHLKTVSFLFDKLPPQWAFF